jgi:hypothetical protein
VSPIEKADIIGMGLSYNDIHLSVINVYISPGTPVACYEDIFDYIENSCPIAVDTVILGDFNIPQYYNQLILGEPGDRIGGPCVPLNEFINFNDLKQNNMITNSNNRILDLVLCSGNLTCSVNACDTPLVPEDSHHPSLYVAIGIPGTSAGGKFKQSTNAVFYNFRKGNYSELYQSLAIKDWSELAKINDPGEACKYFYEEI